MERRDPHRNPMEQGLAHNWGKGKLSDRIEQGIRITHEAAGEDKRK